MKKYSRVLSFLLAISMIFLVAGCSSDNTSSGGATVPQGEKIVWRLQSSWSAGMEIQRQADDFARMVTEMSNGRLEIRSLPSGSVVGGLEVFDAVDNGVLDAAHSASFYWIGKEPTAPMFAAVPAGMTAIEYIMWLYEADGLELWKEMYSDYNFGFVGAAGINVAETFAWSNKPIRSLDDFRGLKFRSVGYWGEILTELGASVVTLPGGEIYGALETGILDAAEFANPESDYINGLHEVAKYAHTPGIHQPTSVMELIINKDSWDKLTPDLQEIVRNAAKATTVVGLANSIVKDSQALKQFEDYGTEIIRLSPELMREIEQKANELYQKKSAADPFFKKVYESQKAIRDKYDYWDSYMNFDY